VIALKLWILMTAILKCTQGELSLLQKEFLVSAGNRSLVPISVSDTLCVIQKMTHFLCRLLSTDTKD
jgi:hypothetical protein